MCTLIAVTTMGLVKPLLANNEPLPAVKPIEEPLVLAEKFSIESGLLEQTRTFYLHLPENYHTSDARYPVLYIPDGGRKMQKTVAIASDLANFARRIPNMIVVGIETRENRTADLSSHTSSTQFLSFITQELQPFINSQYRTNGENLLMGSSMGGEFVVRALFTEPDAFDAYFSISPSIYYSDFELVEKAEKIAESNAVLNKKLYLSVANEGFNQGVETLAYQLRKQPIKQLDWQFVKREEESHGSISMMQGYLDLQHYYSSWAEPHFKNVHDFELRGGIAGLHLYYTSHGDKPISIGILEHMAQLYLDENQNDKAIALAELAVSEHATSGRALRGLATIYDKVGQQQKALAVFEQALATAIKHKHRPSSIRSHQNALAKYQQKLKGKAL